MWLPSAQRAAATSAGLSLAGYAWSRSSEIPTRACGATATLCVLFRMLERPGAEQDVLTLSLSWGVWLALGSAAAIVVGGLWSSSAGLSNSGTTGRFELQR